MSVRTFPAGPPLRDAAHVALLRRLRERVSPMWRWRAEVPVGGFGDERAFDVVLERDGMRVAIEAETRLRDVQALARRLALKLRDGRVDRLIVVVSGTRTNRLGLRNAEPVMREGFPAGSRTVLAALSAGRDPGRNGILLL
ncbi:MAG: hypothetical protein ABR509_01690 [Candidatus Limnocylindria bacterium]